MKRKIIPIVSIVTITIFVALLLFENNSIDKESLEKTFVVDAIYLEEEGYVEITFQDKSKKTNLVTLEILGMPESFQKIIYDSKFTERIQFSAPPKYGWKTMPVTLAIDHQQFGQVGLKTEIHPQGEPVPPIIFSLQ